MLDSDGTPDSNFGNAGKLLFGFNGFYAFAREIRKYANSDFMLFGGLLEDTSFIASHVVFIRFKADGNADTSFGPEGNGVLIKAVQNDSLFQHIKLLEFFITPNEKLVLAGNNGNSFFINRYHPDGSDDHTFGIHGSVTINGMLGARLGDLMVQADGKILTIGSSYFSGDPLFTLFRHNTDGSADSTFGSGGTVVSDWADYGCLAYSVALQEDGKMVVVGRGEFNEGSGWMVARYMANGQHDAGFGNNGMVRTDFEAVIEIPSDIVIDAQHAIYVAGNIPPPFNAIDAWCVAKYKPGTYTHTDDPHKMNLQAAVSPNPSSPDEAFLLRYQLSAASPVSAQLFNLHGQTVQLLFSAEHQASGEHTRTLEWPASLAAGFYFLRLQTDATQAILPVVLR